jgi:hypothetical protein
MSKLDIHGQWVGSTEVTYEISICDSAVFCVECDINELEACEIKELSKMDKEPAEFPTALIWTIYRTVTGFVIPGHMIRQDSKLTLTFNKQPSAVPHVWMHLHNAEWKLLSKKHQFTVCKISGTNDIVMPAHVKIVGEYDYLLLSFRGEDEANYAREMKYTAILKDTRDHVIIRWEEPSLWLDIENLCPDVVCYAIHNGSGECAWYPHQRTVLFVQESHYPCCEPSKYTRSYGCKPCSRVLQDVGASAYYNHKMLFLNERPEREEDECLVVYYVDICSELSADDKFAIVKLSKSLTDVIVMGDMKPDMEVLIAFITGQTVEELRLEHDTNTHFRLGPGCFKVARTSESFWDVGESDSD